MIRRGRVGISGTSASTEDVWRWNRIAAGCADGSGAHGLRIGIFDEATFETTARSFDNPDFVKISIHSYRHRWGDAPGDHRYDGIEARIAGLPRIGVATTVLHGADDGATFPETSAGKEQHFTGPYDRRVIDSVGHFVQRERPHAVVDAVLAQMRP